MQLGPFVETGRNAVRPAFVHRGCARARVVRGLRNPDERTGKHVRTVAVDSNGKFHSPCTSGAVQLQRNEWNPLLGSVTQREPEQDVCLSSKRGRAMPVARCAVEALTALLELWRIETSGRAASARKRR
jgi:hypothetical protein